MKPTILLTTAATMAAAFIQPLQAKPDRDGKGGGGHPAPPAQAAPRVAAHAPQMHARPQMQAQAQHFAPQHFNTPSRVQSNAGIANARSSQAPGRRSPTIAFGGNGLRNEERINHNNNERFGNSNAQSFNRNDLGHSRVPESVFHGWDRRSVHTWNHRSYRWYNNDWVIIDGGYDAPYDYGYDYYSTPAPAVEYGATDSLAADVQNALSRRGYETGGVDGVIGPQTRNAIAAFQEDNDMPVNGRIDQRLVRSLGL
jgi:hypothetical protein